MMGGGPKIPQFYADSAVIAYRVPASDVPFPQLHAKETASSGSPDFALLDDGDLSKFALLPIAPEGEKSWIQWEFPQPQTIRAFTIALGGKNPFDAFSPPGGDSGQALEASDDGETFRVIAAVPKGGATEHTVAFAAGHRKVLPPYLQDPSRRPKPLCQLGYG